MDPYSCPPKFVIAILLCNLIALPASGQSFPLSRKKNYQRENKSRIAINLLSLSALRNAAPSGHLTHHN